MTKFYPHQIDTALAAISNGGRLRLLHETGTGKTYSYLAIWNALGSILNRNLECVIVCPVSLISGMWRPFLMEKGIYEYFRVYSYEYIYRHLELFSGAEMVILDEDHKISNPSSKMSKKMMNAINENNIKFVVGGTGTPYPREYTDFYNSACLYGGELQKYWSWCMKYGKFNVFVHRWIPHSNAVSKLCADYSHCFHVARLSEVAPELSEPEIRHINIDLPKKQKELYDLSFLSDAEQLRMSGLTELMRMRQACADVDYMTGEYLGEKIKAIFDLIKDGLVSFPLIIWGCFVPELEGIYAALKDLYKCDLWRGGTEKKVDKWNAGDIEILVAHPKSAGVGLNLQKSHYLIYHSIDWGLIDYQQSLARVFRLGQNKQVKVFILNYSDTIEQKVNRVIAKKGAKQEEVKNLIEKHVKESTEK